MWNTDEVKRMKLSRVLEILENVLQHFNEKHDFNSFRNWDVDVKITDKGLEIDMKSEEFCRDEKTTAWEEHKKYIRRAFGKKQTHNIKGHKF